MCGVWEYMCLCVEYYSAIKKNDKNAIFRIMDGPGDYRTEWNKSEKGKYHVILLIFSILKK